VKLKTSERGFRIPSDSAMDAMAKRAADPRNPTTARQEATKFWPTEDGGMINGKRNTKTDKRLANRLKMCFVQAGKQYPWVNRRGRPTG
jgi:hypothetical protein